jgi:beta-lactam-binding protein with PASTA domain
VVVVALLVIISYIALAVGTRHGMRRTVPDFTGLALKDAQYYASERGLKLIINDSLYVPAYPGGMVLEQLPKGGVDVKEGRKIYITINSFTQKKLPMPFVAGRSLRQAKNMLESAGFGIENLEYVEDIATNYVLAQIFNGEEVTDQSAIKAEKGSGVTLRVGVSPEQNSTTVPRLISRALFDAKSKLWEQGLNIGTITYDEGITLLNQDDARVCRQSILQGTSLPLGSKISLHLTLDREVVAKAAAEADRQVDELLKQQAVADSLARRAADSLKMLNNNQPQPEQADDEFFF